MKPLFLLLFSYVLIFSGFGQSKAKPFGIIIHGGAGSVTPERISPEMQALYSQKLQEARDAGYSILEQGGTSLDAIKAAIIIMENAPLFNAGKGAVLTHDGNCELDASIMDGTTLKAGAVAGVATVKNPILAASAVMDQSKHVMLSGSGAEKFSKLVGLEMVSPKYFITEERKQSLKNVLEREKEQGLLMEHPDWKYGTVGAVALDKNGNIAAATSTGGMTNKRFGRIGDAPIIAAGTYANSNYAGVSCTGHGEYFIRNVVAYDVIAQMKYSKAELKIAAEETIKDTKKLGGGGGLIAMDKDGNIAYPFSTAGMFRAWKTSKGEEDVQMFGSKE